MIFPHSGWILPVTQVEDFNLIVDRICVLFRISIVILTIIGACTVATIFAIPRTYQTSVGLIVKVITVLIIIIVLWISDFFNFSLLDSLFFCVLSFLNVHVSITNQCRIKNQFIDNTARPLHHIQNIKYFSYFNRLLYFYDNVNVETFRFYYL